MRAFANLLHSDLDMNMQGGVAAAAESAKVENAWVSFKHRLGRMFTKWGQGLNQDFQAMRKDRVIRTVQTVDRLKQSIGLTTG